MDEETLKEFTFTLLNQLNQIRAESISILLQETCTDAKIISPSNSVIANVYVIFNIGFYFTNSNQVMQ